MNARSRFGLISLMLLAALLISSFVAIPQVQANTRVNVGIGIFHDALAPYGNWVNHRTYGQVWYPRNVARDWRPYTDGYWAHTHDYGWLWVSYQPWGWAPFHYGRWAWDNWYGWIWVPGRTWAPAWVFWRSGGGYAAWAPMPPNVVWQPGIGLNISYFNYDRDLSWNSWVAVREYDLPHRHISRRICPPRQIRQIINVTNYSNNVTLINNTIVNQGVPVKQIEEVTRKPVVSVVPTVLDQIDVTTAGHNEGQPNIIRLPIAAPTAEEIHYNEELARRLDGKNSDGTRTELPAIANSGQHGNQEPRVPGRLAGKPAPVQSPYATAEPPNLGLTVPGRQTLPLPAIPETPLVGLSLDSDTQNKGLKVGQNQEMQVPARPSDQQPSANIQPIAPAPSQTDGVSAPVSETGQQSVSTDAAPMPPLQNELQSSESAKQPDGQPLQAPAVDQQLERSQAEEAMINSQQQLQLQQELAHRQDKSKQQEIEIQQHQEALVPDQPSDQQPSANMQPIAPAPSQTDGVSAPVPETDQQSVSTNAAPMLPLQNELQSSESAKSPDGQLLQDPVADQQQLERRQAEAAMINSQHQQQIDELQQELARQQDKPKQQEMQMQQEAAHQQEMQNQQQLDMQRQQVERATEEAQRMQQQEAARQQEMQNQQQLDMQQQQAERATEEAQQMQQQEAARQQEMQNQQQLDRQRQQAERATEEAQQMQQQEAARQQEMQNQQQLDMQRQQAERATEEAQQMQQQEAARHQEMQNQQQLDRPRQQAERAMEEAQQMQQQEAARQQEMQNQQQLQSQQQVEAQQQQQEAAVAGSQENKSAGRANRRRLE